MAKSKRFKVGDVVMITEAQCHLIQDHDICNDVGIVMEVKELRGVSDRQLCRVMWSNDSPNVRSSLAVNLCKSHRSASIALLKDAGSWQEVAQ